MLPAAKVHSLIACTYPHKREQGQTNILTFYRIRVSSSVISSGIHTSVHSLSTSVIIQNLSSTQTTQVYIPSYLTEAMKQAGLLALSACLSTVIASNHMAHQHLHKRDMVTTTVWEDVTETVNVVVTVYGASPGDASTPATTSTATTPAQPPVNQDKAADVVAPPSITPSVTPSASVTPPSQPPAAAAPAVPQKQAAAPQAQAPAPQAQAPEQPASGDASSGGSSGSSQPSGGSCGTTGGKCTASRMTIYNDQGIGACGWTNDTNSQDFFALAAGKCTPKSSASIYIAIMLDVPRC